MPVQRVEHPLGVQPQLERLSPGLGVEHLFLGLIAGSGVEPQLKRLSTVLGVEHHLKGQALAREAEHHPCSWVHQGDAGRSRHHSFGRFTACGVGSGGAEDHQAAGRWILPESAEMGHPAGCAPASHPALRCWGLVVPGGVVPAPSLHPVPLHACSYGVATGWGVA